MNEIPSVHIESAGSKTSDNRPLGKWKCHFEFLIWKFVYFYFLSCIQNNMAVPCLCHLIKIKGYFFQPGRPVFIIVINTSCSGVCYRIYAWPSRLTALWHYLKFLPGVYPVTNALTIGIYYYNDRFLDKKNTNF